MNSNQLQRIWQTFVTQSASTWQDNLSRRPVHMGMLFVINNLVFQWTKRSLPGADVLSPAAEAMS